MKINEAKQKAIEIAADWCFGADWDQFWGEELSEEAWQDDKLAAVLCRAQREIAARIRRLGLRRGEGR